MLEQIFIAPKQNTLEDSIAFAQNVGNNGYDDEINTEQCTRL